MPFRERMRKAFGRTPPSSTLSQTRSNELVPKRTRSQKENVYRIGEPMPQPKYPGKYDKPHQDMLRAFSFKTALGRRGSEQTDVSPMGSRMASRKNSEADGRRSTSHKPSNVAELVENADADDDVVNVGLSRQVTAEQTHDAQQQASYPGEASSNMVREPPTWNADAHVNGHESPAAVRRAALIPRFSVGVAE